MASHPNSSTSARDAAATFALEFFSPQLPKFLAPTSAPQYALKSLVPTTPTGYSSVERYRAHAAWERANKSKPVGVTAEGIKIKREMETATVAYHAASPVGSTIWILPFREIESFSLQTLEAVTRKQGFQLFPKLVEGDDASQIRRKIIDYMPDFATRPGSRWYCTPVHGLTTIDWWFVRFSYSFRAQNWVLIISPGHLRNVTATTSYRTSGRQRLPV